MTDRMVAAIEHPLVDAIGHPTGRKIEQRARPTRLDIERVIEAAARTGTMLEINALAGPPRPQRGPRARGGRGRRADPRQLRRALDDRVRPAPLRDRHRAARLAHRRAGGQHAPVGGVRAAAQARAKAPDPSQPRRRRARGSDPEPSTPIAAYRGWRGTCRRSPACGSAGSAGAATCGRCRSARRRAPRSPRPRASWRRHASAQMIAKPAATAADLRLEHAEHRRAEVANSSGHSRLSSVRPGRSSGSVVCERAVGSSRRDRRRGLGAAAEPDPDQHGAAPPDALNTTSVGRTPARAPMTVSAASSVAAPALSRTAALRKSPNRTAQSSSAWSMSAHAVRAVDHHVGLLRERRRALVGADADPHRGAEAAVARRARSGRGRRRGRSCRRRRRRRRRGRGRAAADDRRRPCRSARAAGSRAPCGPSGS